MASRRTRLALAAAALVAMSAGAAAWLRADRSRESGPGLGDEMPAGRYRIEGFPLALFDARGDPPVVDMADDRPEVTLDLFVKAP